MYKTEDNGYKTYFRHCKLYQKFRPRKINLGNYHFNCEMKMVIRYNNLPYEHRGP